MEFLENINFFEHLFTDQQVYIWEQWIDDWFLVFALAFLMFELLRLMAKRMMSWNILGDTVVNFITLIAFIGINISLALFLVGVYYFFHGHFTGLVLPINWWTIGLGIIVADFCYYWYHRASHVLGLGWATHTVHHSSPYFNISVAYRFGPLDGIFATIFHIPMALLGFHPLLILFTEKIVQLFQTALHTEVVGKLPAPIEYIFNTPSHHRVHHGSNPQYIDKNYGGIFIIWDRMFGTFEKEEEKVIYGVIPPLNSINPFTVFFHGIIGLAKNMWNARGLGNKLAYLIKPPGWHPKEK